MKIKVGDYFIYKGKDAFLFIDYVYKLYDDDSYAIVVLFFETKTKDIVFSLETRDYSYFEIKYNYRRLSPLEIVVSYKGKFGVINKYIKENNL